MDSTIHGKLYYDNAYRAMVGLVGPKWISFCYFGDGGVLKIRKVRKHESRFILPIHDNRSQSTPQSLAKRFLHGRRSNMTKRVRAFLDRVAA